MRDFDMLTVRMCAAANGAQAVKRRNAYAGGEIAVRGTPDRYSWGRGHSAPFGRAVPPQE